MSSTDRQFLPNRDAANSHSQALSLGSRNPLDSKISPERGILCSC